MAHGWLNGSSRISKAITALQFTYCFQKKIVMHMHLGCKWHPFISYLVYYVLWNYSESTKQKWENVHTKCSRKKKFLRLLWKSRDNLRKSYTFTVIISVWAYLDLSLSVLVFDERVPLGSVRIQTDVFHMNNTGVTSCCASYREWHFFSFASFELLSNG